MNCIPLQRTSFFVSPFRIFWTWMSNLTSQGGHLLSHNGNLLSDTNGCTCCNGSSGGGCPCADLVHACSFCTDATPTQFHITFTGVSLCTGCVNCDSSGTSLQLSGSSLNGTFVLTENGTCGWSAPPSDVPVTATFYTATGCTGTPAPAEFGIDQIRISSTQFQLQVVDSSGTVYLFRATIDLATCCNGYTAPNELTDCGCAAGSSFITAATGGTATVTPC